MISALRGRRPHQLDQRAKRVRKVTCDHAEWCPSRESNSDTRRCRFLRPVRLPISPDGQGETSSGVGGGRTRTPPHGGHSLSRRLPAPPIGWRLQERTGRGSNPHGASRSQPGFEPGAGATYRLACPDAASAAYPMRSANSCSAPLASGVILIREVGG